MYEGQVLEPDGSVTVDVEEPIDTSEIIDGTVLSRNVTVSDPIDTTVETSIPVETTTNVPVDTSVTTNVPVDTFPPDADDDDDVEVDVEVDDDVDEPSGPVDDDDDDVVVDINDATTTTTTKLTNLPTKLRLNAQKGTKRFKLTTSGVVSV